MNKWKKIRRSAFRKEYILNQQLIKLAKTEKSHAFLANAASLHIYTYLVQYIKAFAQEWFEGETLKILDWGCGKGHISFLLDEIYKGNKAHIDSCDIEAKEFAHGDSSFLQKTPLVAAKNITILPLSHAYHLPFSENTYDIVLSFGVLEHVPNDQESLKEINRILKPHGLLFCFFLPYHLSWTQKLAHMRGNYYHDRLYGKKQVREMLFQSKFNLIDMWHRQLLPKNSVHYTAYQTFENMDQWLCEYTPLKYIATNIEFVACKHSEN